MGLRRAMRHGSWLLVMGFHRTMCRHLACWNGEATHPGETTLAGGGGGASGGKAVGGGVGGGDGGGGPGASRHPLWPWFAGELPQTPVPGESACRLQPLSFP